MIHLNYAEDLGKDTVFKIYNNLNGVVVVEDLLEKADTIQSLIPHSKDLELEIGDLPLSV